MELLHAVPTFYGCNISVTGIPLEERRKISRIIQMHGGSFVADLHSACSHLLVGGEPRAASPKITYAKKWGLPMVKLDWLYECIAKRICLEHEPFLHELAHEENKLPDSMSLCSMFPYSEITAEEINRVQDVPQYLEGCHVYVGDSLPNDRLILLKRLILSAGGTRHSDLYDRSIITHFIVHNQTLGAKELDQLAQFGDSMPLIIHDQWLFACFYAKERLPTDKFAVAYERILDSSQHLSQKSQAAEDPAVHTPSNTSWSLKLTSHKSERASSAASTCDGSKIDPPPKAQLPIFAGLSFCLFGWDSAIKKAQVTELIEKNGGVIQEGDDADYHLAPMIIIINGLSGTKKSLANELWLYSCISAGCLMDEKQRFFIPLTALQTDHESFSTLKISVTGFSGIERDYYSRLIASLGATYTDNLTRNNTHLIAAVPSGPKYEFAQSAPGIAKTSPQWLIKSIEMGRPANADDFPIEVKSQPPIGKSDVHQTAEKPVAQKENVPVQLNNTPSAALPSSLLHLSEDNNRGSTGKRTADHSILAIETPIRAVASKRIKEVATAVTPTGLTQVASHPDSKVGSLLKGLVFAISARLWHRREEIHDMVTEMGGSFIWSYDPSCTHYVHQGNMMEENFREFRLVRQHGKKIVSPWWLIQSKERGMLLNESSFPHIYNPQEPISDQATSATVFSPLDTSSIDYDKIIATSLKTLNKKPKISIELDAIGTAAAKTSFERKKVFALSGLTPDQRTSFPLLLEGLGAKVSESSSGWEPGTTHLIIGSLTKSEKFLAALASRAWVLRPEYAEACRQAGKFVDELEYEWTSSWSDDVLAGAPRACRIRRIAAFINWTVLLAADQKRIASLKNILLAGGATVHTLADADLLGTAKYTHVLISSPQMKAKIPVQILEPIKERVHNVELIPDHLISNKHV